MLGEGTGPLQGAVHLNGVGNEYELEFYAKASDGTTASLTDGTPQWLGLVDAHRIESGFYAGINGDAAFSFRNATRRAVRPLAITELARFSAAFGNLYNTDDKLTYGEGTARIIATVLYGLAFGEVDEIRELVDCLGQTLFHSGSITKKQYTYLSVWGPRMLEDFAKCDAGLRVQASGLIVARFLELFEQPNAGPETINTEWQKAVALLGQQVSFPSNFAFQR
jgi:hypothetical protein